MYGINLWSRYSHSNIERLRVTHNNAYSAVLHNLLMEKFIFEKLWLTVQYLRSNHYSERIQETSYLDAFNHPILTWSKHLNLIVFYIPHILRTSLF